MNHDSDIHILEMPINLKQSLHLSKHFFLSGLPGVHSLAESMRMNGRSPASDTLCAMSFESGVISGENRRLHRENDPRAELRRGLV
jgi:hypothetical protein